MRNVSGESIRDCYGHAERCRRRAKEQSDSLLRQDFLDCERRWLLLARGYELAERMEALSYRRPSALKSPPENAKLVFRGDMAQQENADETIADPKDPAI